MAVASYVLGFVLSSLLGFGFHLWKGGKVSRIVLYLVLSWAGFWISQVLGSRQGWESFSVGPLLVGLDILGAVLFLGLGHWLSLVNQEEE